MEHLWEGQWPETTRGCTAILSTASVRVRGAMMHAVHGDASPVCELCTVAETPSGNRDTWRCDPDPGRVACSIQNLSQMGPEIVQVGVRRVDKNLQPRHVLWFRTIAHAITAVRHFSETRNRAVGMYIVAIASEPMCDVAQLSKPEDNDPMGDTVECMYADERRTCVPRTQYATGSGHSLRPPRVSCRGGATSLLNCGVGAWSEQVSFSL